MNWKDTLIAEQTERERKHAEELKRRDAEDLKNLAMRLGTFLSTCGIERQIDKNEIEIDGVIFRIYEQQYKYYIQASIEKCQDCHAPMWSIALDGREDLARFLVNKQHLLHTCPDDEQTDKEI